MQWKADREDPETEPYWEGLGAPCTGITQLSRGNFVMKKPQLMYNLTNSSEQCFPVVSRAQKRQFF